MKLYIKYMVSSRCKDAVRKTMRMLGLHFIVVELGEIELMEALTEERHKQLKDALLICGLELMDDKRAVLIESIKKIITEMVYQDEQIVKIKFSDFLSEKLNLDYTTLANLFSEVQGTTIEKYLITHKVSRIKELLKYGESSVTEIAASMNYSSVAHLSNQFKKITGLTPSQYKVLRTGEASSSDISQIQFLNVGR